MSIKVTDFKPAESLDEVQRMALLKVAIAFTELAAELETLCPASNHRAICMNHLLTAKMFASQSITHTGAVKALGAADNITVGIQSAPEPVKAPVVDINQEVNEVMKQVEAESPLKEYKKKEVSEEDFA